MSLYQGGGSAILRTNDIVLVPGGGGTGPQFPIPFNIGGTTPDGEVTRTSAPSPVGTGSNWTQTLQQLALAGGAALISKYFPPHDSRSTKNPYSAPSSSAGAIPGKIDPVDHSFGIDLPATLSEADKKIGSINPLYLAAAAALVVVVVLMRR